MSDSSESSDQDSVNHLDAEQLEGLRRGVAATIMPVNDGWRVHYFSLPSFEEESGTDFPSLAAALQAVADVLSSINSAEQRERAAAELQALTETPDSLPATPPTRKRADP